MTRDLRAVLLGAVMVVGAAVCFGRGATFAEGSARVNMVANIGESLTVSSKTTAVTIVPNLGGTFGSGSFSLSVATNASAGYTASMTPSETTLSNRVDALTVYRIPTLGSGTFTQSNFTMNRWGISINGGLFNDGVNYHAIASGATQLINANGPTGVTAERVVIDYGAKLDTSTVSGEYSALVNFEVVAKIAPKTIHDLIYMQDYGRLTASEKYSVAQSMTVGDQYKLIDSRDNKMYFISKQADGHLWMTQNLDLELYDGLKLTSLDTDINDYGSGFYVANYGTAQSGEMVWLPPAAAATSNYMVDAAGSLSSSFPVSDTAPYSADGGDVYVYPGPNNDFTYRSMDICKSFSHTDAECTHYHVGNYYNWTAAIASSDSSSAAVLYDHSANSICPFGWGLPTGREVNNTAATRMFGQLFLTSGVTSTISANSYASGGFGILHGDPLYFVRGGYIYDEDGDPAANTSGRATSGEYWSRTYNTTDSAFNLEFNKNAVYSATIIGRYAALSIRCRATVPSSP